MKLTEEQLQQIQNGELSLEEVNETIQSEVTKSYQKGRQKTSEELEIEKQEIEKQAEIERQKANELATNVDHQTQENQELAKQLEEIKKTQESILQEKSINEFRQKANGKLTSEQINNLINITDADKLNEINIEAFARVNVADVGKQTSNNPTESTRESLKKGMLDILRR